MTTALSLWNGALRLCGERKLTSTTENREARRLVEAAWGDGSTTSAVKHCLQLGQWSFAMRTVMIDASPSVEPPFGYTYAFDQPSDMVKVAGLFQDEFCQTPLLQYADERHYWFAELETIYVRYVSNDADYGADFSLWPESFVKVVEAYLANEIVLNLTQSEARIQLVEKAFKDNLQAAKSLDGANSPTRFMPEGSWVSARRGNRTRLTRQSGGWQ